MDYNDLSLEYHKEHHGKIEVMPKTPVKDRKDLSVVYTPGVAAPCLKIAKDKNEVYTYTSKGNMVAVVTDGTAVLGLGDIGPEAGLPVMEGKCALFKQFGGIDAFPVCLDTKDVDEIVETVVRIAPSFGGINLEDISAPRCFEVEEKLKRRLSIPVFHDDQHGTAIVLLAALINSLKIVKKNRETIKVVINGTGAAGSAIGKLLMEYGVRNVLFCDRFGIVTNETATNEVQRKLAKISNPEKICGSLADALIQADVFIGVSTGNCVSEEMIASMNKDACVFPMANPTPEISVDLAKKAGARIVGTGRSDYPNQINNLLVFPGIFKGALEVRSKEINEEMKIAAAIAIASLVKEEELSEEYILPTVFTEGVAEAVAGAVKKVARESGLAQT